MRQSKLAFIRQMGFTTHGCQDGLYAALMFQPFAVGVAVLLGTALQSPWVFLILSIALWWSAAVPTHSPFDAVVNHVLARPLKLATLPPAPEPRRFAAGMAGTFAMAIAFALTAGAPIVAWLMQGMLSAAVIRCSPVATATAPRSTIGYGLRRRQCRAHRRLYAVNPRSTACFS